LSYGCYWQSSPIDQDSRPAGVYQKKIVSQMYASESRET